MYDKKSFGRRAEEFMSGKGFYIVLCVCALIIGLSAWFVYKSISDAETPQNAGVSVSEEAGKEQPALNVVTEDFSRYVEKSQAPETEMPVKETPDISSLGETPSEEPEESGEDTPSESAAPTFDTVSYVWPVSGTVENDFTGSELVYSKTMSDWRVHQGIDIACDMGTRVLAVTSGTVAEIRQDDLYGTTVVIDHGDGLQSVYCNLSSVPTVSEGEKVSSGSVIGAVGDTADLEIGEVAHLHFELICDGQQVDPADYLPAR